MGDSLLQKETLALPEIVEILGPRPYPFKASIQEYLQELRERSKEEEKINQEEELSDAEKEADESPKQ